MKRMERAGAMFDRVNGFFIWFIGISLAIGWFATCYEVVMRYFLHRPTQWTLEYLENMLVFITFLGAAWVLKSEGHVSMDLILTQFPPRTQASVNCLTSVLCAAACLIVTGYGAKVVCRQIVEGHRFPTILETPMWPLFSAVPVGFFLLFVECLRRAYRNWGKGRLALGMKERYFEEAEKLK